MGEFVLLALAYSFAPLILFVWLLLLPLGKGRLEINRKTSTYGIYRPRFERKKICQIAAGRKF